MYCQCIVLAPRNPHPAKHHPRLTPYYFPPSPPYGTMQTVTYFGVIMRAILFGLLITLCDYSYAGLKISDFYIQEKRNSPEFMIYIAGLSDGFFYSTAIENGGIYCPPRGLKMNTQNYIHLIEDEIKRGPPKGQYTPDMELGIVLGSALMRTFPCK
jgi:hypothetical protein